MRRAKLDFGRRDDGGNKIAGERDDRERDAARRERGREIEKSIGKI